MSARPTILSVRQLVSWPPCSLNVLFLINLYVLCFTRHLVCLFYWASLPRGKEHKQDSGPMRGAPPYPIQKDQRDRPQHRELRDLLLLSLLLLLLSLVRCMSFLPSATHPRFLHGDASAGTRASLFRCLEPSSPLARQFDRGCLSNHPSTYPLAWAPNSLRGLGLWCLALCIPCHPSPIVA